MSFDITLPPGAEVDESSDAMQLIRQAILFENVELLNDLLKENTWAADKFDRYGRTPLMLAAHNGREKALHVLLNAIPNKIDQQGGGGKTALHFAAEAGECACAGALLGAGADMSLLDSSGHCALEGAHIAGHHQLAQLLIESIQSDNERIDEAHKELLAACVEGDAEKVNSLLSSTPPRHMDILLNGRVVESQSALFVACQNGRLEIARRFLDLNEKHVLVQSQTLDTVVHAAISSQNVEVLNLVLQRHPALISNCNIDGSSSLHWAAQVGSVEIVKCLLEYPFEDKFLKEIETNAGHTYRLALDVNLADSQCRTPLYVAVANGHQAVVEYMLAYTVSYSSGRVTCPFQIDVYCTRGRTPLMVAAFNQNLNMISILLSHDADVNLPLGVLETEETDTVEEARCVGSGALAEAARADALHIVQYLLGKGAVDTDNRALQLAAQAKSEKIVRVLLCRLAHPDPEYKVNKKNVDVGQVQIGQSLLPSSLCPSKPAMLSWAGAGLESLVADWFISAALHVNTRLKTTRLALAAITRIDLSNNRLTVFPSLLFQMPSLRLLNLGGNQLKTIEVPSYYISSTCLEILILKHNKLDSLSPRLLSAFPSLHTLDVSHNQITYLPEFIWMCPSLKELNASNNLLTSLPIVNNRSRLTRTSNAGIGPTSPDANGDDESPGNVEERTLRRQNIWMDGISLSKVDDEQLFPDFPVTSSSTLTTLNLSANKIQVFPNCLACTSPLLRSLNLSHNQLTQLAPIQCMPAHLRSLDVSNNRIKDLFPAGSPMHLICHAVAPSPTDNNQQSHHPALPGRRRRSPQRRDHRSRSKSAVRSQRSLSVSRGEGGTVAEEACVHKRHDTLEWMKTLNVSGNVLSRLPLYSGDRILLPALTVLEAADNQIKTIPAQLGKMGALSVLTLNDNPSLNALPPELGVLARLWSLSLKGCPLKEPLYSMVNTENSKTVEIVAYLKTILEESKTFRHLNLMFLGEPGSGRSSLWDGVKGEGMSKRSPVIGTCARKAEFKLDPKTAKGEAALGPVGFTAWDFVCSRREYSSVYQYVLTRRAVHVVIFRATEGEEAIELVGNTLVNIQARAPNSCVLIVATHVDQIAQNPSRFPEGFLTDLEEKVRNRLMVADADKRGLPRVTDALFINSKSRSDIRSLCKAIYRTAWEVRLGKERALDAQVPSSYVALLKIVRDLNVERRELEGISSKELVPVMTAEQLKEKANGRMVNKFGRGFRDDVEFSAAVTFLHDCGEIVHYEDASLRAIYFTDPLFLCDLLTLVISCRGGDGPSALLPIDNLLPVFKLLKSVDSVNTRNFIVDLLHKCEVALVCQNRVLLVPAHLPDEYRLRGDYSTSMVKLDLRISSWRIRSPTRPRQQPSSLHTMLFRTSLDDRNEDNISLQGSPSKISNDVMFNFAYKREDQLRRLYAMSYIPSGFWARLITRIIGDANVTHAVEQLFWSPATDDCHLLKEACRGRVRAEWVVWQTGIEMLVKGHSLFTLKQFIPLAEIRDINYSQTDWVVRGENRHWRPYSLSECVLVEMLFPSLSITVSMDGRKREMRTDEVGVCSLMALIVDLVDTLLEDWYPSLGTRFMHSSEGDLLVSRFIPCTHCAQDSVERRERTHDDGDIVERERKDSCPRSKTLSDMRPSSRSIHAFSAEECMLASREDGYVECPRHGPVYTRDIAPDTLFVDIEGGILINSDSIKRGRLLGRGAFGFVFRANVKTACGEVVEAAQKMLEPVDPGAGGRLSAVAAYKAAAAKWDRDSLEYACRAYCTSRQELNLLSRMRHPNVICLLGVCTRPLSLVVELAPLGALNHLLASYKKSGARLPLAVIKDTATQVAKAVEYLHQHHIIYRDLKSENVLAWRYPPPFSPGLEVLVKLGDYGISRSVLPSGGAKGFGGTEGFMAPEIVRFNGEEEYTQKVDCFSFGMFLYEVLTLKLPFEGEEHVKERLLEGARPVLLPHELLYPLSLLDLMVLCWSPCPDVRPSSSQIVSFCTSPEFSHVLDVTLLNTQATPTHVMAVSTTDEGEEEELDGQLWLGGKGGVEVLLCTQYGWLEDKFLSIDMSISWICPIRDSIWVVSNDGSTVCFSPSLHEINRLKLPSLERKLVSPPELLSPDLLTVSSPLTLCVLRLDESGGGVTMVDKMDLPMEAHSSITLNANGSRQIWTGHADGVISAHHIGQDDKFSFASSLSHPEALGNVCMMRKNREENTVWTATDRGSRVLCWDLERNTVISTLDVRKVMPTSETIHTIDTTIASETTVSALCVHERSDVSWLYVGTSTGVLIVAHAYTLQPITACRPYGGPLSCLTLLEGPRIEEETQRTRGSNTTSESVGSLGWMRDRVSETVERFRPSAPAMTANQQTVLITVGKRYRSLTDRFFSSGPAPTDDVAAIIWRTDDWL